MSTPKFFTANELITWLVCFWRLQGKESVLVKAVQFHSQMERMFWEIETKISTWREPNFIIRCHQIHGESQVVADMLCSAVFTLRLGYYRGFDSDHLWLDQLPQITAEALLENVPVEIRPVLEEMAKRALEPISATT